jgi:hypothetical protein
MPRESADLAQVALQYGITQAGARVANRQREDGFKGLETYRLAGVASNCFRQFDIETLEHQQVAEGAGRR